ncbi:MAG: hypothetical protein ABW110_11565 [Steroidobacteraceae bacterium]
MSPTVPSFEIRQRAHEFQGVHETVIELVENELDVIAFVHREELARPFAYALDMLDLLRRVATGEECAGEAAELVAGIDALASTPAEGSRSRRFDGMIPVP